MGLSSLNPRTAFQQKAVKDLSYKGKLNATDFMSMSGLNNDWRVALKQEGPAVKKKSEWPLILHASVVARKENTYLLLR